jgi:hypothetical protein
MIGGCFWYVFFLVFCACMYVDGLYAYVCLCVSMMEILSSC